MGSTTTNVLTSDPTFARMLVKTLISSDFADSGDNTFAETQALLPLAGIDILLEVHLARFRDIAKSIKFADVTAINTGANRLGTADNAFTDVSAANEAAAKDAFNLAYYVAVAKKCFKDSAALGTTGGFSSFATANDTIAAYLAQPVSPGVGPSWYKVLLAFSVGIMSFKIKFNDKGNSKYDIIEVLTSDADYEAAEFYSAPPNPIKSDFTAAKAVKANNGPSLMKPIDIAPGSFKAAAAVLLATGIDTSSGSADLSSIDKANEVLEIVGLITLIPSGDLLFELNSLTTGSGISKTAIGDASDSDLRLGVGIRALSNNNSYAYASSTPLLLRSVDFATPPVYRFSDKVTKVVRWLKIVKKDNSALSEILLGSDSNSSDIKAVLQSTATTDVKAAYFTTANLTTADTSKDKTYSNGYKAAVDATSTGTVNILTLVRAEEVANYLSSNGTANNTLVAPTSTTSNTTGINANEGNFDALMSAYASAPTPTVNIDLIFEALMLVAARNNKSRGVFEDIYKIISTWFATTPTPQSQKPTTSPVTNLNNFWTLPAQSEFTEEHARRLVVNYILTNYNIRLLADPRNKSYFDLLFKIGTNTGANVNPVQATNLFAYNPSFINSNAPVSRVGTPEEIFAILNKREDLSTFTKLRFWIELKYITVNSTDDIMDIIALFGKEVVYEIQEMPLSKNSDALIVPANTADATTQFGNGTNFPNATTSFYVTFTTNNDAHKKLLKRNKVIASLIDILNEDSNSSIKANKLLDLAKSTSDFGNFIRFHTNYNTNNNNIFKTIIENWLANELASSIEEIVVSKNTYGSIVKNAIKNYVTNTLGLASKALSSATDTTSATNTALLIPSISGSVLAAALLGSKVMSKDANVDDSTKVDSPLKLNDFIGTASKQDMLLIGLIASIKDGSMDITKLNDNGRKSLLEAGVSLSDIALLVLARNMRSDAWTLSKEIKFTFLAGQDTNGLFVSDPN